MRSRSPDRLPLGDSTQEELLNTQIDTDEVLEVSWSYTFSMPSGRSEQGAALDASEMDNRTRLAYHLLAHQLEAAAYEHGMRLTRSVSTCSVKAYRFGGGLTESVVQVLGAVGGVAGIAGLLKDFLPIIRDWKKSSRNLSVTLKRNGTEVSVSGAQTAEEVCELLETSVGLAARKLPPLPAAADTPA